MNEFLGFIARLRTAARPFLSATAQARAGAAECLIAIGCAALLAGCSSATTSVSAPSGGKCDVSVTNSMTMAPAAGGSGTLSITTARDCTWTATSDVDWVTIVDGGNGQGDGTSTYRVAENPQPAGRQTELRINDRRLTVAQAAACRYRVTPATVAAPTAGGTVEVQVETAADCAWTASSDADWIRVSASGRGPQAVALQAQANSGGPRSARVTIAGQVVTVTQPGGCAFAVDPVAATVPPAGGAVIVSVGTTSACTWTAATEAPWLTVSRSSTAPGPATVTLTAAVNPGPARSATATIAGTTVTVSQEAGPPLTACQIQLSAPGSTILASGGSGSVGVTTNLATCTWPVSSSAPWLHVSGTPSGTGNGTIGFTVDANPGPERSATLAVADKVHTVTQAAAPPVGCVVQLTPPASPIPAAGGTGSIAVTTSAPTCGWSVTSNSTWLVLSGASNRTGSGTIGFSAEANSGPLRSAAVTVAGGETYAIQQAAAPTTTCTYAISGSPDSFSLFGGPGSVTITTADGCAWTAQSSDRWIVLKAPTTGSGSGQVNFEVSPGLTSETGTIRIVDQVFTVRRVSILPVAGDVR